MAFYIETNWSMALFITEKHLRGDVFEPPVVAGPLSYQQGPGIRSIASCIGNA